MAEESSGQEKTEEATSRRLTEAREKGDVAKSMEVPSALVLLVSLFTIYETSGYMWGEMRNLTIHYLSNIHTITVSRDNFSSMLLEGVIYFALLTAPVLTAVLLAALIGNYAQVGVLFTTEKITPELSKIDPIQGLAQKFSLQTLNELLKSLLKIAVVCFVVYKEMRHAMPAFMPLMDEEPGQIMAFVASTTFWIFLKSAILIAIMAAIDYAFQRWQFMKKMRMTKQEIKEEAKQTEGDPQVKGRIRALQMEMARNRMMEAVPSADVVITNPTRLAVALRYDRDNMDAPLVVAKGAGLIAQKIKEIARENGVAIVEDKPLARALFKAVKVDQVIPEDMFQAVAEVLAYVYGLGGEKRGVR